jgi:hypothetical protein
MTPFGILVFLLAAPPPPTPTPALGPAATPVVVKPRSLADVARENRERAEKGEKKEGTFSVAGGGEVAMSDDVSGPPPPSAKRGKAKAATTGPAEEAGTSGPDETYWKNRAQRLRDELDAARKAQSDEEARRAQLLTTARNSDEMVKFAEEIQKRVNVCRLRVEAARKQLDALPEEARKAGVNPGAIR